MRDWAETYQEWYSFENLDSGLRESLTRMDGNEVLLEDCFYKDLEFGTGGMRGELGPGTNRLNLYTIRKAALGLANYISSMGEEAKKKGVVIAYDPRHQSLEFAMESAKTLATQGVKAYLFERLSPTPLLSFAVRHLQASGGIVITASHNPHEYNGFKVYGEDGGQIPPAAAKQLIGFVQNVGNELAIEIEDKEKLMAQGSIFMLGNEVAKEYLNHLLSHRMDTEVHNSELKIVFSPLHGTSYQLVKSGLEAFGFMDVTYVEEQVIPDPYFSTVKSPNPEEHEAFELAIQYGQRLDADLLMATDPDADRIGIAVKDAKGQYGVLTGNQTGAILLYYILSQKRKRGNLPGNGVVLKTIVTSEIGRVIAEGFGLDTVDTLTGFKFIGEKIGQYKESGEYQFLFGYEESYGYLIGDFVRDKDAVQAAVIVAEAAAYYKRKGKSLNDVLQEIYEVYGYFKEDLISITLKGKNGAEQIESLMENFRVEQPAEINGNQVRTAEDFLMSVRMVKVSEVSEIINLPKSNVLKYTLEDGSWFCLRPSGTEPKIKFYFGVQGRTLADSETKLKSLKQEVMAKVYSYLY